jgi:mannose-1-phosphate guanylyltransferase
MDIPSISIDYAMRKQEKKKVVSSQFDWSDLGSLNRCMIIWHWSSVDENGHGDGTTIIRLL